MYKLLKLLILTLLVLPTQSYAQSVQRTVEFEFEEIEGAKAYHIEIQSSETKKVYNFKTKRATWKGRLKPGPYEMKLRSIDDRGVPGPWSEPQPFKVSLPAPILVAPAMDEKINSDSSNNAAVRFEWETSPGAKSYRLVVKPESGDTVIKIVEETSVEVELPVALLFTWQVYALEEDDDEGVAEGEFQFQHIGKPIDKPEIAEPRDEFVQNLNWKAPEFGESYSYILERKDEKRNKWKKVEVKKNITNTEFPFDMNHPGGNYRLRVKAHSSLRKDSKVAKIEFPVFSGKRDPASVEKTRLKRSVENPSHWNFFASYMITSMSVEGTDNDTGRITVYDATGGSGLLGLGFTPKNSHFGGEGNLAYTGYRLGDEYITYAEAAVSATYRRFFGINRFKVRAGLFYKEMQVPEVRGTDSNFNGIIDDNEIDSNDTYDYNLLAAAGPQLGIEYWHPLNYRYGIMLDGLLQYQLLTMETPNNSDLEAIMNYQIGILGSYRIKEKMIGYAGYKYRLDQMVYPGSKGQGNVDNAITGHYLNLILHWGF